MIFQPELAAAVMAGRKTVTRRLLSDNPRSPWWRERCRYTPGKVFTVNPGRGKVNIGRARVVDVRRQLLAELQVCSLLELEEEARKEGFASSGEFWQAFRAINGDDATSGSQRVWRIEFEVIP